MDKAKEIYSSLEKACEKGDIPIAEEKLVELESLIKEHQDAKSIYSEAVVKVIETFKGRLSSSKVKKYLSSVEALISEDPKDEKMINTFARAIRFSLTAISTKGQPSAMKQLIEKLETLANENPKNEVVHEELSFAALEIVNFWRKRGSFKELRSQTEKFRKLAEKFPDNEQIKMQLTRSLILEIDSSNKRDIDKVDSILLEIQSISESQPRNVGLQLEWVHAYITAMNRAREAPEDNQRWLNSIKSIAQNQKDESFKVELARGYLNAIGSIGASNTESLNKHLEELEMLADTTRNNLDVQIIYAESILASLKILGIKDTTKTTELISDLEELSETFPDNKKIIHMYTESLLGVISMFAREKKGEEMVPLLDKLKKLDEKYPDDEFIQQNFDQLEAVLKMIGFKRSKKQPDKTRMGYM